MSAQVATRCIGATFLILAGVLVVFISLTALIDPAGTKMADDGDPFGVPPSRLESTLMLLAGLCALLFAGLLLRSASRIHRSRAIR